MATGSQDIEKSGKGPHNTPARAPENLDLLSVSYQARVFEDMRDLFQDEQLADVMLAADGHSLPCHKFLLAASSGFFRDKFVINPDTLDGNLMEVEDVDFETLKHVVSFVYRGDIELTVETARKIIRASVMLAIPELTQKCERFLLASMDNSASVIETHRIARLLNLTTLADRSWEVMLSRFQETVESDAFNKMSEAEVEEYISDAGLDVPNEDAVFTALVRWVKYDMNARRSRFESLVQNLNLSNCSLCFLRASVRNEPLMESENCYKWLTDALLFHVSSASVQCGTPREGYSGENALLVWSDQGNYVLKGETWAVGPAVCIRKGLTGYSVCMSADAIFVTGGVLEGKREKQCWKLALDAPSWAYIGELNIARDNHDTVCMGNRVYILGGGDGKISLPSVECLTYSSGSWNVTRLYDMQQGRASHTAVSHNQVFTY